MVLLVLSSRRSNLIQFRPDGRYNYVFVHIILSNDAIDFQNGVRRLAFWTIMTELVQGWGGSDNVTLKTNLFTLKGNCNTMDKIYIDRNLNENCFWYCLCSKYEKNRPIWKYTKLILKIFDIGGGCCGRGI